MVGGALVSHIETAPSSHGPSRLPSTSKHSQGARPESGSKLARKSSPWGRSVRVALRDFCLCLPREGIHRSPPRRARRLTTTGLLSRCRPLAPPVSRRRAGCHPPRLLMEGLEPVQVRLQPLPSPGWGCNRHRAGTLATSPACASECFAPHRPPTSPQDNESRPKSANCGSAHEGPM